MNVTIVPTGTANLASILGALSRVGARPAVARDPGDLDVADALVLPGVGNFAAGRQGLDAKKFTAAVCQWILADRPFLAICLGMQLLATGSDEAPDTDGLGILDTRATRLPDSVSVPQLGWNVVRGGALVEDGYAYYANSYRLTEAPVGWRAAMTDHGGPLVASLERGPQLLCQFHPELSGGWGHALLGRWLDRARAGAGSEEQAAC
jgi:imidazole glycerol phosphate synthase glutamine amidotransferase subunit